ncbi:transposon protein [Artemisia annua]|uniref:Transposon protein n=1 Tax=Artemisia annua TaxID=35608 RepID=A0A2U1NVM4_ARTAN|nr:transposon protein [Artemisia annua]
MGNMFSYNVAQSDLAGERSQFATENKTASERTFVRFFSTKPRSLRITMERQWMYGMSLNDPEFVKGVESFLIAAESNRVAKGDIEIFCPCSKCKNFEPFTDIKTIEWHLHRYGFVRNYTCWSEHGESLVGNSTSSHVSNTNENNDSCINDKHENLKEMLHDLEANDGDIDQEDLQQFLLIILLLAGKSERPRKEFQEI